MNETRNKNIFTNGSISNSSNTLLKNILSINDIVTTNFFRTCFQDKQIEEQFQNHLKEASNNYTHISISIIIILYYLATLALIFSGFYSDMFIIGTSFALIYDIIFNILFYTKKLSNKQIEILTYFKFIFIFIVTKLWFSVIVKSNMTVDETMMLLRITYFSIYFNNIMYYILIGSSIFSTLIIIIVEIGFMTFILFYFIHNNTITIPNYFLCENLYAIIYGVSIYLIKKRVDLFERNAFSKQYMFYKCSKYYERIISGLNTAHIIILDNNITYSNEIFTNLINSQKEENIEIRNIEVTNKNSTKNDNCINNNIKYYNNINNCSKIKDNNYKNIVCNCNTYIDNYNSNNNQHNINYYNSNNYCYNIDNKLKMNSNDNNKNNNNDNDYNNYNSKIHYNSKREVDNEYVNVSEDNNIISNTNNSFDNSIENVFLKQMVLDEIDDSCKYAYLKGTNLYDTINKIKYDDKIKEEVFERIGTYNNGINKRYFDVLFRKKKHNKDQMYMDIIIQDVTEFKLAEMTTAENKIKQKFLAKIAHEFKTPLNTIIGLTNQIKFKLNNSENIEQDLDLVSGLSNYTIFLIKDVILYASGMSNNTDEVDINNTIINNADFKQINIFCFNVLQTLLKCREDRNNVKSVFKYDESIEYEKITLKSDEIRIKQILLNFISNAVKFTKYGNICLEVKLSKNKKYIKIFVIDTGCGIKSEDKNKIFTEYTMLQNTKTINKMGNGLGLSICKMIADKMQCKINFVSVCDTGSKFYIAIPCINISNNNENTKKLKTSSYFKKVIKSNSNNNGSGQLNININYSNNSNNSNNCSNSNNIIDDNSIEYIDNDIDNQHAISKNKNASYDKFEGSKENIIITRDSLLNETLEQKFNISRNNCNSKNINKLKRNTERINKYFMLNGNHSIVPVHEIDLIIDNSKIPNNNNNDNQQQENVEMHLFKRKTFKNNNNTKSSTGLTIKNQMKMPNHYCYCCYQQEQNQNIQEEEEKEIIVIIDDNQYNRKSVISNINKMLKETNNYSNNNNKYKIVEGSDGVDLLKLVIDDQLNGNKIKCIITDENMEYMNGSDTVIIIRQLEQMNKIKRIKIVSCTALDDMMSKQIITKSGVDSILSKPTSVNELQKCFESLKLI